MNNFSHPRTGNKKFFEVNLFLLFDLFFLKYFSNMNVFTFGKDYLSSFLKKLGYSMWPYIFAKRSGGFFRKNIFRPDFRNFCIQHSDFNIFGTIIKLLCMYYVSNLHSHFLKSHLFKVIKELSLCLSWGMMIIQTQPGT